MKAKLSIVLSALLMTGCLDVKDNDANQELASAVQAQNEILKEQSLSSHNLVGMLENTSKDGSLTGAKVELKVGSQSFVASTINADGSFELLKLPFNSDYTLHVTSADNAFLNRVVYGTTRSVSPGISTYNIGTVYVSKGVEKTIAIVDADTKESITGLTFYTYVHTTQDGRDVDNYLSQAYASTYDAENGTYKLTLPADLLYYVSVSFDLDGDKHNDYRALSNSFNQITNPNQTVSFLTRSDYLLEQDTILLEKNNLELAKELQIRLSLIDKETNSLLDVSLSILNDNDKSFTAVYDTETNQYVADVTYNESIRILMPSFTQGDKYFESNQASINRQNNAIQVNIDGFNRNGALNSNYYMVDLDESVIDLVLGAREIDAQTPIEIVNVSPVSELTQEYNVFYSQAIGVLENSASLTQKDKLVVTLGNASVDDLWVAGTTLISEKDIKLPVETNLTLNNTKLTIKPKNELEKGFTYQYEIGKVSDVKNELAADVNGDDSNEFEIKKTLATTFDINSLVLENNNYFNNGVLITASNTAGTTSSTFENSQKVILMFPENASLDMFENFTLKVISYIDDGVVRNNFDTYRLVSNGSVIQSLRKYHVVQLASNEAVVYDNINSGTVMLGSNLSNGVGFGLNLGYNYLSDNVTGNENSMTFEYSYELKTGEIKTGTVKFLVQ
jgi:hypothetical protein